MLRPKRKHREDRQGAWADTHRAAAKPQAKFQGFFTFKDAVAAKLQAVAVAFEDAHDIQRAGVVSSFEFHASTSFDDTCACQCTAYVSQRLVACMGASCFSNDPNACHH